MSQVIEDVEAVVSLADVAEMAHVTRPAVSNWRRRFEDFPQAVSETGAVALFRLTEVRRWMRTHRKDFEVPSITQQVWSALNLVRGDLRPEEAALTAMAFVGLTAAAVSQGLTSHGGFEEADGLALLAWIQEASELVGRSDEVDLDDLGFTNVVTSAAEFLSVVGRLAIQQGFGEVFEALASAVAREGRATAAYRTPPSLVSLLAGLAYPLSGRVYNPSCGQGEIMATFGDQVRTDTGLQVIGRESDPVMGRIAWFRLLAHGIPGEIHFEDALRSTAAESFDHVLVADPSFADRQDLAWVRHASERLAAGGRAFVITAQESLSNRRGSIARRDLVARGQLRAVLALPSGMHRPHVSAPAAVWCLGPADRADREVLFVDLSASGVRAKVRTELSGDEIAAVVACLDEWERLSAVRAGLPACAVPAADLLDEVCDLRPVRWIEHDDQSALARRGRFADSVSELDAARKLFLSAEPSLGTVAIGEVRVHQHTVRELVDQRLVKMIRSRRVDAGVRSTGGLPLIRPSDLTDMWEVVPSATVDPALLPHAPDVTMPGDVLVLTDGVVLRAAVDDCGGAVVAAPIHTLRCLDETISPLVLAAFLDRSLQQQARGAGSMWHVDLYRVAVPVLDRSESDRLARVIRTLTEQKKLAEAAARAADQLRDSFVDLMATGLLQLPVTGDNR